MNWNKYPDSVLNGCAMGIMKVLVVTILLTSIICSLSSCKQIEYVSVPELHTEHHWHTDTVRERDSTHTERNTIIRELDSAAMARYGIQMQANQRAWLVLQREMEERLRDLEHKSAVRDTVRDSVPVPYPVEVIKTKTNYSGWIAFSILLLAALAALYIFLRKRK